MLPDRLLAATTGPSRGSEHRLGHRGSDWFARSHESRSQDDFGHMTPGLAPAILITDDRPFNEYFLLRRRLFGPGSFLENTLPR